MASNDEQRRELEPCPFCGKEGEIKKIHGGAYAGCYQPRCSDPECIAGTVTGHEHSAIATWNRRAALSPSVVHRIVRGMLRNCPDALKEFDALPDFIDAWFCLSYGVTPSLFVRYDRDDPKTERIRLFDDRQTTEWLSDKFIAENKGGIERAFADRVNELVGSVRRFIDDPDASYGAATTTALAVKFCNMRDKLRAVEAMDAELTAEEDVK